MHFWQLHSIIGALKTAILQYKLYEIAGIEIQAMAKEIDSVKKLLRSVLFPGILIAFPTVLIIDAFDNSKSRQLVKEFSDKEKSNYSCLHIGFSGDYGEIIWNQDYRVPDDKGEDDCDYPLARNLIMLLTGVASEAIVR
ncbi:unnamed protein product, partial [marine sediment metagenome]